MMVCGQWQSEYIPQKEVYIVTWWCDGREVEPHLLVFIVHMIPSSWIFLNTKVSWPLQRLSTKPLWIKMMWKYKCNKLCSENLSTTKRKCKHTNQPLTKSSIAKAQVNKIRISKWKHGGLGRNGRWATLSCFQSMKHWCVGNIIYILHNTLYIFISSSVLWWKRQLAQNGDMARCYFKQNCYFKQFGSTLSKTTSANTTISSTDLFLLF